MALASLFETVSKRGVYFIIVTSDHAGHDRQHGTSHPDDYKLPLIIAGERDLPSLPSGAYLITKLRGVVQQILAADELASSGEATR